MKPGGHILLTIVPAAACDTDPFIGSDKGGQYTGLDTGAIVSQAEKSQIIFEIFIFTRPESSVTKNYRNGSTHQCSIRNHKQWSSCLMRYLFQNLALH